MIRSSEVSTFFGEYLLDQKSISKEEVKFAYKHFYVYTKLYKTIGRMKIFEKLLDKIFVSKKTHKTQLFFYPVTFFITSPVLASYRLMMSISPTITRRMRDLIMRRG
jgi:hypothetical protein